jgi:hypothetical protein
LTRGVEACFCAIEQNGYFDAEAIDVLEDTSGNPPLVIGNERRGTPVQSLASPNIERS